MWTTGFSVSGKFLLSLPGMSPMLKKGVGFIVICLAGLGAGGCGLAYYQPYPLVRAVQKIVPDIVFFVPTDSNFFALTFDDGPNPPYTDRILEILSKHEARSTFFVTGRQVEKYPQYVDKFRQEGHQVANHLYLDRPTIDLSSEELLESLNRTESLVVQQAGRRYVRPAGGLISPEQLKLVKEREYVVVLGSAYVSDPHDPPRFIMLESLKTMLRPGIIIVLHDGGGCRQKTVDILDELIQYAAERGLVPVTVEELIKNRAPK